MALPSNALLAVLTTFAFLLSGCTTAEPAAAPPSPAAPVGTVSAEGGGTAVGTIRGVVTDEEAMPIQNATIAVKELNLELTTTEAGAFEFLEVPFGKYTLIAAILGYNSATRSVTIDAENPDAETTFSLTALVVREIYHTTFTWQGLMTCGATLVTVTRNAYWPGGTAPMTVSLMTTLLKGFGFSCGQANPEALARAQAITAQRADDLPGRVIIEASFGKTFEPRAKSAADRIGVISFNIAGVPPHDLASILDERGIAIRTGHHCAMPLCQKLGIESSARISLAVYNTKSDIDEFIAGMNYATKLLR